MKRKKRRGLLLYLQLQKIQLDGPGPSPHLTMFERDGARLVRQDLRASFLVFSLSLHSLPPPECDLGVSCAGCRGIIAEIQVH